MADGSTISETERPLDEVEVVTFGCRLNAYESEAIRARAAEDGLSNAVVFNTCAVTGEAVRQARQAIRRMRRERPDARLIVTGCAAQIDPQAFGAMQEVDLVLGNAQKAAPGAYAPEGGRVRVNDIFSVRETAGHLIDGLKDRARAYVEVQNGCDHRCTFCIIPYGRGNSRSAAAGEVVEQIRRLAAQGYREVVLTGVDITSWGQDLPGSPTLGQLVSRILKLVPELPRLRLSSIDAAEIDPDLMRCLAEEPRLMPYLHLSLQAGDDMILKRMKRRHLRADSLRLVEQVRAVRPDVAFGADLIAGFPTETEAMFENTLSLVDEADLSFLHVFPFSPRPGTPAERMPQVERAMVKARAQRLRQAGEAALARHLERQVGRLLSGLVERDGVARAEDFTELRFEGAAPHGEIVQMRVVGHDGLRLQAVLAGQVGAPAGGTAASSRSFPLRRSRAMNHHPELEQDREANVQSGQPIGAEDLHATVSASSGAPEEARTIPDPDNGQKASFVHPRTSPLPPEEASEASELRADDGSAAMPMDEVTSRVIESDLRPSAWEATGRGQDAYEDRDAPEADPEA